MNRSVPVITSQLEFVDLKPLDISPLISECVIKVLYIGENRNHSYISKDTALEMAKGLRGNPIVGYYKTEKQDFRDHGERIVIDGDSFDIQKMTKPYGFVSPVADVWFQTFEDDDQNHPGQKVQHEYLMTTGYLWTGRYPDCKVAIEQGRPQSMELDSDTLEGHWSNNPEMDFFIIDAANISALTILGDDVEPCFEGASVERRSDFALKEDFTSEVLSMLKELKFALEQKGEKTMVDNTENFEKEKDMDESIEKDFSKNEENVEAPITEDFKKKDDEEESKDAPKDDSKNEEPSDSEEKKDEDKKPAPKDEDDEDKKKKYSLLEADYNTLKADYDNLQVEYAKLVEFKNKIEDEQKDAIIAQFAMLSDEDKKMVVENKRNYTCEQVEEKLAAICFRKKISFSEATATDLVNNEERAPTVTFNLEDDEASVPAFIKALKNTRNNRK